MSTTVALAQMEASTGRMLRNLQSRDYTAALLNAGALLQQLACLLRTEPPTDPRALERWKTVGVLVADNAMTAQVVLEDIDQFGTNNGIVVKTHWLWCMLDVLRDALRIDGRAGSTLKICECGDDDSPPPTRATEVL